MSYALFPAGLRAGVLSLLLLSGCGGGGTSDGNASTESRFTFSAELTNKCGVKQAFKQYDFFLQDENWQTLKTYQPNDRGEVSFVVSQAKINFTLVAKAQQDDEPAGFQFVSYADVNTASNIVYQARFDSAINNGSCQCEQQDVVLRHRPLSTRETVMTSAPYDSWQAIDERTTEFNNVEVCRIKNAQWPLHSFAVTGKNEQGELIGAAEFVNDFTPNAENTWQITAIEVLDTVETLPVDHGALTMSQLIEQRPHLTTLIDQAQTDAAFFIHHLLANNVIYETISHQLFERQSSLNNTINVERSHRVRSEILSESLSAQASSEMPNIDIAQLSEISADNRYDFTQVGHYPLAIMSFELLNIINNQYLPVRWLYIGPQKGTLPLMSLTGYEHLSVAQKDIFNSRIQLVQSLYHQHYQSYLTSLSPTQELDSNNMRTIIIDLE